MLRKTRCAVAVVVALAAFSLTPARIDAQVGASDSDSGRGPRPRPPADAGTGPQAASPGSGATGPRRTSATGQSPAMSMSPGPLGIPMTRMGSGTSWLPDAAAMRAVHVMAGSWELMVHGSAFVTYDAQYGGPRGATQFGSQNWGMFMASHALGGGRLELRSMLSAEPATATDSGYPLLLQSGEAYDGRPLHDRQHPHDVFMETAADYQAPLAKGLGLELYGGPAGEPALGPVAFPHRPSASADPFAPLGHHWQDATHVIFGVLTAALFTHDVKLEASTFNGREPDQHRADFDLATPHDPTFDSYSTRITVNPGAEWSASAWYGYLRSPDQLEPTVNQHRMGAALLNAHPVGTEGQWSSALIYGANLFSNDRRLSNSVLAETNLDIDGRNTVFGRAEFVTKAPDDLDVPLAPPPASNRFDVESVMIGYVREIGAFTRYGTAGIGGLAMLDAIPGALVPTYHTRTPSGFAVYLRLRPSPVHRAGDAMDMGSGRHM